MEDMRKRFALYGLGFFMGLLLVFFFLGGKRASCNWMPNDRILNIIRQKKILFSEDVHQSLQDTKTDSTQLMQILMRGDVDFDRSQVKNDPCRLYWIQGLGEQSTMLISVEVCDSIATVNSFEKNSATE